jgi:hypothetical protein
MLWISEISSENQVFWMCKTRIDVLGSVSCFPHFWQYSILSDSYLSHKLFLCCLHTNLVLTYMIDIEEFQSRISSFPKKYKENFDYMWKWKIRIESKNTAHILEEKHIEETYHRLCAILPKWKTYRNGDNANPLETLKDSLVNISEAYSQLRTYTLLDFDSISF